MKIVIVGGVAGGMSAATRLRRLAEDAEIVVIERSGHVSFANCGLPYYVGGVITERDALLLQTPESLAARFDIDVRVASEVTGIDRAAREVRIRRLDSGEVYAESYDWLILSPGASPIRPEIDGIERALSLRDIEDVDAMAAAVPGAQTAVIMGGGFIGLELAENLTHRGLKVSVIELADQLMAPLDPEMAQPVQAELEAHGVGVHLEVQATRITADAVELSDGRTLPADLVVAAIGVRPESRLAAEAGLEIGPRGGIVVDTSQRTSDPAILAVGDAVEKFDAIGGFKAMVPLAGPANRQGRLAADVIAGREAVDPPVLGTAIVGLFGLQAAATGWNEKRLRQAGRPYRAIHIHPGDHAGYYPGAETISLKLLIDPETDAILGAQGTGRAGVDKRIDVIATALRAGLSASDLADLELTYAPQFGSAKDPVNMLGFIAENHHTGLVESVQWHEVAELVERGVQLIDVRTPGEFARGAIPGAINIPVDDLRSRLDEVTDDVVVHCQVGLRGHVAQRLLAQHSRRVRNLDGGYRTWQAGAATRDRRRHAGG